MASQDDEHRMNHEKVENVSDLIGSWGPLQKRIFSLLCVIYCVAPFNNESIIYYTIKSDLWCQFSNGTKITIAPDKCSFKELASCSAWGHDTDRNTIIREWNLVCEDYWLRSLAQSAYPFGYLISSIAIGIFSDKYGRRTAIFVSTALEIVCSIGLALSSNIYIFIVLRSVHGIGGYGRYLASLILIIESVESKLRGRIIVCYEWVWYSVDYIMIAVTYNVSNFRYIYMGTIIYQLMCLGIIALIPESPRWQLVAGKTDQAEATLRKYSAKRRRDSRLPDDLFDLKLKKLQDYLQKDQLTSKQSKRMGIFDLFRETRISKFCLTLYFLWFVMSLNGSGLYYSSFELSGNVFINNAILLTASVAACCFMAWKVDSFRRRSMLIIMFFTNAVLLSGAIIFVDSQGYIIPRMILLAAGSFSSECIFTLLYICTPEIFPTNIRHLGVGTCSVASRLASISAPFIIQLSILTSMKVTFGAFVLMACLAAGAATLLPETKGKEIPDTVEDMLKMYASDG